MKDFKFVYHAVSPLAKNYEARDLYLLLEKMFVDIFMITKRSKCIRTITLPLIGSGASNAPLHLCYKALFEAIEQYIKNTEENTRFLRHIKIVNINNDVNTNLIRYFCAKLKSNIF